MFIFFLSEWNKILNYLISEIIISKIMWFSQKLYREVYSIFQIWKLSFPYIFGAYSVIANSNMVLPVLCVITHNQLAWVFRVPFSRYVELILCNKLFAWVCLQNQKSHKPISVLHSCSGKKIFWFFAIIAQILNLILHNINFSEEGTAISVAVFVDKSTLSSAEKWITCRWLNFIFHSNITSLYCLRFFGFFFKMSDFLQLSDYFTRYLIFVIVHLILKTCFKIAFQGTV